jgi:hypothetical protein
LFSFCQKELLVGQLGDMVDQANTVVNVVAIQQSNVFVTHQYTLFANGTHAFSVATKHVLFFVDLALTRKKVRTHSHCLGLAWVEAVLELRKTYSLNVIHFTFLAVSWFE